MRYSRWLHTGAVAITLALASCAGPVPGSAPAGSTDTHSTDVMAVKHIIFMLQENRSFDHYFGMLGQYRAQNGYGSASDIDGMPANASNPADDGATIHAFHLQTGCIDNVSPDWLESHGDVNRDDPASSQALMNGFVHTAAGLAQFNGDYDTRGVRAMGYYDGNDLPFYYYMASQFATSDRWFSPTPTNSEVNRMYVMAATSQGHAHKPSNTFACCTSDTIFHRLEAAGVSWKIYYTNLNPNTGKPLTDVNSFWSSFADAHSDKIVPVSQYFTDLNNNSLPAVAFIQTGYLSGQDEHPGGYVTPGPPWNAGSNIQYGAQYVAKILTSLMQSPAWISSTFIFAFDEGGGLYDHVPPMFGVPNPDGIPPQDLIAGKDPSGDFTRTGFRVPFMVVSPFAKKHYVSHTAADSTAILAFIEKRFGLQPLTKRDAAQMDMTEFFDFVNVPWAIPPSPPSQPDTLPCDRSMLPSNP